MNPFLPSQLSKVLVIAALLGHVSQLHAETSLESALDLDVQGLGVSNSASPWACSTIGSHDGFDVAVSSTISHNETTAFTLNLTGPDTVTFWWKTSTEQDFDLLSFSMNDVVTRELSGESEWEEQVINVPVGSHALRWAYTKDSDFSEGQDRAWIDEIRVASQSLPTALYPSSLGAHLGEPFEITPTASDTITTYSLNGSTPTWVNIDPETGRISGHPTTTGEVSLSVSAQNANGSTTPQSIVIRITNLGDGLEALASGWHWQGEQPWGTQQFRTHDGIDALQSGSIGHGDSSELRLPVVGPAVIRFWWRVDSEESHDFFDFLIDGSVAQQTSGLKDWERQTIAIPAGPHTISWRYQKDATGIEGEDAAWLDDVEIIDGRDPDNDGFSTLVEVCLGMDWKQPSTDPMELPTESGGLLDWQITKGGDLEGLTPILEISYDLKDWAPLQILSPPDSLVLRGREPAANIKPCKFVRVRAGISL